MVKKTALYMVAVTGLLLAGCLSQSGSVSPAAVEEMLASPRLAVTSYVPAWLHAGETHLWGMSEPDRQRLCAILRAGESRNVPELAYQVDDENHPLVQNRFYIYASNAQCLAATVLNDRVVMHDVVLTEEQERELFRILTPYLEKVVNTKL